MPALSSLSAPLALAMWDFTWLLRHYPNGAFEDWGRCLDELQERGYDALRIEIFPHLLANDPQGGRQDVYRFTPRHFGFALWGGPWTIDVDIRQGVLDFLSKCQRRGIRLALSSWLPASIPARNTRLEGPAELVRIWDETLTLLAEHDLLQTAVYVDVLNEYPDWHGFTWLHAMLATMAEPKPTPLDIPGNVYNARQKTFYRRFMHAVLTELRGRWPAVDFTADTTDWRQDADMDYSAYSLHDNHLWMVHHREFIRPTGYWEHIHPANTDAEWAHTFTRISERWREYKSECELWLDEEYAAMRSLADRWNIPLGSTEGHGAIFWADHPALNWNFIREAGEIAVRLGAKHRFAFNCTSNFCHPHFVGMWRDIDWHRQMTKIIKSPHPRW
ncbi:MAG TPA: cellulase-like family protein [Tepidisphaeraceae bacterium]|jgi:hypothetical protein